MGASVRRGIPQHAYKIAKSLGARSFVININRHANKKLDLTFVTVIKKRQQTVFVDIAPKSINVKWSTPSTSYSE
jgi:hypothetical protein